MAARVSAQQSGLPSAEHAEGVGGVEDLATLTRLDEQALLDNLRRRYDLDLIYTYVGDILVAVNPFKQLAVYGNEVSAFYRGVCLGKKPSPHVYAIAQAAYCNMTHSGKSQCCVISGESGAGKTESTKFLISHLISLCPQKSSSGLEQKIIQVNPLLEAFGNAKTVMNNNSSRFGKYIQVKFKNKQVVGAKISEYLLEKSRVAAQGVGEENFHVFYYMFAGLPQADLNALQLTSPAKCHYLKDSASAVQANQDRLREEFDNLVNAMDLVGFTSEDQRDMFQALSAVLHIGNVDIGEDASGKAVLLNPEILKSVSANLGIHFTLLDGYFTSKETVTAGEIITIHLSKHQALDGRDAMAKALYGRMFSWIILRVNSLLAPKEQLQPSEFTEIGILDIFGFEHFEVNSFEQLCINLANEQLQFFFNQHIFLWEQQEYAKEGVDWTEIPFVDNRPLLEMFLAKPSGMFALLDEQSIFPRATDLTYVQKLEENFSSSPHYGCNRDRQRPQFAILHYAGKVHYEAAGFLEKNRDSLPTGAVELFQASSNDLIHDIFMGSVTRTGTLALGSRKRKSGKSASRRRKREETFGRSRTATGRRGLTVGAQFKNSLKLLMEKMSLCSPHFVRCIKPNTGKAPGRFQDDFVLSQLRYTGMLETTRIRREGYAIRPSFDEFVTRFKSLAHLNVRANQHGCQQILKAAGITGYHMGKTKVFLKYFHLDVLARHLEKVHQAATVLQKVLRGHVSRKSIRKLWNRASKEKEVVVSFVTEMRSSSAFVFKQLANQRDQDARRPNSNLTDDSGDFLPAFDLPPPPSIDELRADLMASATVSSDSSSGEEEVDGFDIDEVDPMPDEWRQKYRHLGKEGTRAASLRWFKETQAPCAAVKEADGKFCKWFHGIISRREAEILLTNKPQGCFLIRVSETRFGYSLSFRSSNRCKHFMIDQTPSNKYLIVSESRAHLSLQALVLFHQKVPICGVPWDLLTVPCGQDGARLDYADLLERSAASSRNTSPAPPPVRSKVDLPSGHIRSQPAPPPVPKKSHARPTRSTDDLAPTGTSSREDQRRSHLASSPPAIVKHRSDSWKKKQRQKLASDNRTSRDGSTDLRPPSSIWTQPNSRPRSSYQETEIGRSVYPQPSRNSSARSQSHEEHMQTRGRRGTASEVVPDPKPKSHGRHATESQLVFSNREKRMSAESRGSSVPVISDRMSRIPVDDFPPPPVPCSARPNMTVDDGYSKVDDELLALPRPISSADKTGGEEDEWALAKPRLVLESSSDSDDMDTMGDDRRRVKKKSKDSMGGGDGYQDLDDIPTSTTPAHRPVAKNDYDDIDVAMPIVSKSVKARPPAQDQRSRRAKLGSSRRHSGASVASANSNSSLVSPPPSSRNSHVSLSSTNEDLSLGEAPPPPSSARPMNMGRKSGGFSASCEYLNSTDDYLDPADSSPFPGPTPPPPVDEIFKKNVHRPGQPAPPVPQSSRPDIHLSVESSLDNPRHSWSPSQDARVHSAAPPPPPHKHILNPQRPDSSSNLVAPSQRPRSKTSSEVAPPASARPVFPRVGKSNVCVVAESPYLLPEDEIKKMRASVQPPPALPGESFDSDAGNLPCFASSSVPVRFGDSFMDGDMFDDGFEEDGAQLPYRSDQPCPHDVSALSIPEDKEFQTDDIYLAPLDNLSHAGETPPLPDRNYSRRDLDKSLDADIHRYNLLLQEEQMQLKMLQWRMADTSIGPDDYASLVKREQRCVARMTNFNHALASLEVSKNVHSSASAVDGLTSSTRVNPEARSSALRSGSTLRKRIEAQKQRKRMA